MTTVTLVNGYEHFQAKQGIAVKVEPNGSNQITVRTFVANKLVRMGFATI